MSNERAINVALVLALGLFVASAFLSTTAFAASTTPNLSYVPVYISVSPSTVTHTEPVTTTINNKGSISYSFNEGCVTVSGKTMCTLHNYNYSPGKHSGTETFKCVSGEHLTEIEWFENTAKHYESHSAKLSANCP